MKDNGNENVSVGFIIEPVHQNNKRKDANDEIQAIEPSLTHYIGMVIAFDTRKGKMPYSPVGSKKHGSLKEIHS